MKHLEFELQKSVCRYLNTQYPDVFYLSDTVANVKLTMPQAGRNKAIQKQGFKCPDLIVIHPKNGYFGLFIEFKNVTPYKKNGHIKASQNDHLLNQGKTLYQLEELGYKACFAWSFEQAKDIIDNYMK